MAKIDYLKPLRHLQITIYPGVGGIGLLFYQQGALYPAKAA